MTNILEEHVFEAVVEVLKSSNGMLGSLNEEINMETDLAEDLGVDSLRLVSIMSDLEDRYEIEFSVEDTDARRFHYVSDIVHVTLRTLRATGT